VLLSELLQPDVIRIGLQAADKWRAIEELVDMLVTAHELRLNDRRAVIDAVRVRERSSHTGLAHGFAVPHGVTDCVNDVLAAMGTSTKGIPFDPADGEPARLLILVIIPKGSFQAHVRTLAGISGVARNEGLRARILEASTPEEILSLLREAETA
jgi:PTS system fructose-specific IIC component